MNKDDFYYLGKILKTHGNKGHVMVYLDVDNPRFYSEKESVYLDLHGERIPFFIASFVLKSNKKALVLFRDFESLEDAETLCGLEMFMPIGELPTLKGRKFYFHEIIGFSVEDNTYKNIGTVAEVLELPHQSLLRVRFQEKDILIPVVDDVIGKVDRKKRIIHINAPEGLIDIYL